MSDFNLIPNHRLARKRRRARMRIWAIVCSVYVVGLTAAVVVAGILFSGQDQDIAHQLAVTSEQIDTHNASMLEARRELAEATTQLEIWRVLKSQPNWSKLLVRLSEELGSALVLSQCQLSACDPQYEPLSKDLGRWLSSRPLGSLLSESKYNLTLGGYGRTQEAVSQFVLRLEDMGLFDVVRLINSKRQAFLEMEAVSFRIECHF